jgi:transposase
LLTSVPGIGQTLATVILLETGPIERFAEAGNFASYARCVDSVHTSNRRKKGRRQRQERQQISRLGIRRGGELRQALLPRGQAFLRAQESQDQQHRRHQGVGAQAGARLLSHPEGGQAVRRNALLRLKDDDDPASHVR